MVKYSEVGFFPIPLSDWSMISPMNVTVNV